MIAFPQTVLDAFKQSPSARTDLIEWLNTVQLEHETRALEHVTKEEFTKAAAEVAGSRAVAAIALSITSVEREEVAQHEHQRSLRQR